MMTKEQVVLAGQFLVCDECGMRGVRYWADAHAAATGHGMFTVEA